MKELSIFAAFLGGALVGAAAGLLLAPEKGTETRERIAEALRKKGIKLNRKDMNELATEIANNIESDDAE